MDKAARKQSMKLSEMNFTPVLIAIAVILVTLGKQSRTNCI